MTAAEARQIPAVAARGRVVREMALSIPMDPYLSLKALASYSDLSVRKLREYLDDLAHPLPCYRVGGKILVRRSEFDAWMAAYRQRGRIDIDRIAEDTVRELMQ